MKIGTHNGTFHADDVFALAVLKLVFPDAEIVRTRDEAALTACDLRVDVGGKYNPATNDFDHHQQEGAGERTNGIPYASIGLIWKHFGEKLCSSNDVAEIIDRRLVQPLDAGDCGTDIYKIKIEDVVPYLLDEAISVFNPKWQSKPTLADYDACFDRARLWATELLKEEIASAESRVAAREVVRAAIAAAEDPRLIILEPYVPWGEVLIKEAPKAKVIVFPREEGGWAVRTVPNERGSFAPRITLPEEWAGKNGAELAAVTGVPDAVFCHRKLFIAGAGSKEGALELAHLALENFEKNQQ